MSIPFPHHIFCIVEHPARHGNFLVDDIGHHILESFKLSPLIICPFLELCGPHLQGSLIFQNEFHMYKVLHVGHDIVARPYARLIGFLPVIESHLISELLILCDASSRVIILFERII
jgi:hypothetical protein